MISNVFEWRAFGIFIGTKVSGSILSNGDRLTQWVSLSPQSDVRFSRILLCIRVFLSLDDHCSRIITFILKVILESYTLHDSVKIIWELLSKSERNKLCRKASNPVFSIFTLKIYPLYKISEIKIPGLEKWWISPSPLFRYPKRISLAKYYIAYFVNLRIRRTTGS